VYKKLIYAISFGLILCVSVGVTNADLIAYWPFDEGSGDVAKDVIGGFDAQLTDMDWVPGQFGGSALESSGGGDEILVDPAPSPATEADLSIAWWMVDTYDSWHTMMNKYDTASTSGNGILLRPTGEDSPLRWRLGGWQAYGGWGTECRVPQGAYNDGEWTHVACTYDSASDTATIYINAELAANGDFNPKTGIAGPNGYCEGVNDPAQNLVIVGQQETYGGTLDDVAMWDHALAPDEVLSVFALGPQALDPSRASRPQPGDEADDVARDSILAWDPGESAVSRNTFLGTSFADVNDASVADPRGTVVGQDLNTTEWDPGRFEFGQTYYWRVDEVNGAPDFTSFEGTVWSFTAEPISIPITSVTVMADSAPGASVAENTINGSGLVDDLHGTTPGHMWVSAAIPATIEFSFDRAYKLHELWIWNSNQTIEAFVGFGAKDVVIETSADGATWTVLEGVGPLARAPGSEGYAHNNTIDFAGAVAQHVRVTISSAQGIAPAVSLSEVRFFYIPTNATGPTPASGATNVAPDTALSWGRSGREADHHEVYIGTDASDLVSAGSTGASSISTDALDLALGTTYSWRVDEVNDTMDPSVWTGDLWSFTTVAAISVDDIERYKDEELLEIWATWIDGFAVAGNGSLVGNGATGSPETGIVHGGTQSLPLHYDNVTATQSEATRTFDAPMDWTQHGVGSLVLYFQGSSANTGGSLYVKINDTKIAHDGDASSLTRLGWGKWTILLAEVGANLNAVSSLTLGVENGGQGVVYIDDIQLTTDTTRASITPVEPVEGLELYLALDGDFQDASGKGRHGTAMAGPLFEASANGQGVSFNGIDQYIEITGYKGILAVDAVQQPFTISNWVSTTSDTGNTEMVTWGLQGAATRVTWRVHQGRLRTEHAAGNLRGNTNLNDGEWHHVALTVSEGASLRPETTQLYVDGQEDSYFSGGDTPYILAEGSDVNVGRSGPQEGRYFVGSLDEVRVYSRHLSAGEVAWLAGRSTPFERP